MSEERCPACGDAMKDGKCTFCGYTATEYDTDARRKWAEQKASMEDGPDAGRRGFLASLWGAFLTNGGDSDVADTGHPDPAEAARKISALLPRREAPPARPKEVPAGRPPQGHRRPKAAQKKPEAKRPGARGRPGRFKRLLFKAVVILWFLAYALAVGKKLWADVQGDIEAGAAPGAVTEEAGDGPLGEEE